MSQPIYKNPNLKINSTSQRFWGYVCTWRFFCVQIQLQAQYLCLRSTQTGSEKTFHIYWQTDKIVTSYFKEENEALVFRNDQNSVCIPQNYCFPQHSTMIPPKSCCAFLCIDVFSYFVFLFSFFFSYFFFMGGGVRVLIFYNPFLSVLE